MNANLWLAAAFVLVWGQLILRVVRIIPLRVSTLWLLVGNVLGLGAGLLEQHWVFVAIMAFNLPFNYMFWRQHKDDDDDDNHRGKRLKRWIKSRLPKPAAKPLPETG